MYGRGHGRTFTGKQHKTHGTANFTMTAAERVQAWEKKQAEAKVKASQQ